MTDNETKIVKAKAKKDDGKDGGASKVQIKAVDIAIIEAQKEKAAKAKAKAAKEKAEKEKAAKEKVTEKKTAAKTSSEKIPSAAKALPKGAKAMPKNATPMPKSASAIGKPMPKNAVPQKKADTPQTAEDVLNAKTPVIAEETAPKKATKKTTKEAEAVVPTVVEATEDIKEKAETKAEEKAEAKTEVKTETKEASEVKAPKEKKEKAAPKKVKEEPVVNLDDYAPKIEIKVKRTAAQEAEDAAKRRAQRDAEKKAAAAAKASEKPEKSEKKEKKQPKEFVGRKRETAEAAPRKKVSSGKGDKVVAYQAPAGGSQNGGNSKGGKNNRKSKDTGDRDKFGSKFNEMPTDLSRKNKNKHSKYKETKVEEVEVVSEEVAEAIATGGVVINVPITLAGFCEQIEKSTSEAIMALMKMGIMANINQNLDEETAVLLGMELGVNVAVKKVEETEEEEGIDRSEDREADLKMRSPVITVMGHVDHGKTSILDAIRKTNVTSKEAGGITQAIGASEVMHNGQRIVFLDTPGHEAFTAMRARGAHITDIAVLVVAADDSVKPQTIESISHAKAAGVPIIVAINKIDKPAANIDMVKKDLADNGVLVEEWGGNTIAVPVSAKTGEGIDQLLEMILLQAEMLELKANPDRLAQGTVIEARLDKSLGPVATLLVMNGTLQAGAAVVAGTAAGRVRTMKNDKGLNLKKAGPATAVEITGLTEVPVSGDEFFMVRDDKTAKEIAARRAEKIRADLMAKSSAISLEKLFSQIEEGEVKDLNIIIKADVQGSVEALQSSLEKLKNENVRVNIIHTGVGTVTESDVMLAGTSNALIIGFNVRPSSAVQAQADRDGIEIRCYRIIYEIIDDIEAAMKGMLNPVFKEVILGKAEVRNTFKVPNVGIIGGCYVIEGKITRNAQLRLVRDGIVIHEGKVSSLKRFKDDAKEVATGYECGLGIENYNDIKEGDIIEAFEMQEVKRD